MSLSPEVTDLTAQLAAIAYKIAKRMRDDSDLHVIAIHLFPAYITYKGVPMSFDVRLEIKA